jgi:anti-sigma regulatory factor (Ser/Thr protein kinase)
MESVLSTAQRQTVFHIGEPSQIATARRAGSELAQTLGFDEIMAGRVALVITEAATNIVKHAGRGEILLRPVTDDGAFGIEIVAIDSGPGMSNLALNMEDGNSTAGSYGVGLGAMLRQSGEFDVYTVLGGGTVVCMLVWGNPDIDHSLRPKIGVVCLPLTGEEECGDAWTAIESAGCLSALVVDGLGHGPDAARASRAAVVAAEQNPDALPADLMQDIHGALHGTRGAAVAITRLDFHTRELHFAGIGNIAAVTHEGDTRRHMMSHSGIVGSNMRKVQEFVFPWTANSLLIMHSDGIGSRWDMKQYPGLVSRHPSLVAAVIYRDFARMHDDATILVVREH